MDHYQVLRGIGQGGFAQEKLSHPAIVIEVAVKEWNMPVLSKSDTMISVAHRKVI